MIIQIHHRLYTDSVFFPISTTLKFNVDKCKQFQLHKLLNTEIFLHFCIGY